MKDIRIGQGYDVHRFAAGLPLIIAGVNIPSDFGCVAHSDGDVALHAVCDAILGAAAMGDIGKHFPDTSPEFKGIDSRELLSRTVDIVRAEGYSIGNIDVTVALQAPRIAPYIEEMRMQIARAARMDVSRVSVKATTTEKLGFVGRGEGVEAYAVTLLYKE